MTITWRLTTLEQLTVKQLYAIVQLRQQVFIVEQQCIYLDCDGLDTKAHHLVGWSSAADDAEPLAYLRILGPSHEGGTPAIGRLVIHPDARGKGLGKEILTRGLQAIDDLYPQATVVLSAQLYLLRFYEEFGFHPVSKKFVEDGIMHIRMARHPSERIGNTD